MRIRIFALAAFLLGVTAAHAQPVTSIGPVTPGNFAAYNSPTVIKDSGLPSGTLESCAANYPLIGEGSGQVPGCAIGPINVVTPAQYPYGDVNSPTGLGTGISYGFSIPYLNQNWALINNGVYPFRIFDENNLANGYSGSSVACSGGTGGSGCGGKTFAANISWTGQSAIPISYTGLSTDTPATVATAFCAAVLANTTLTGSGSFICDASFGGGTFNIAWSVLLASVSITSTGTDTITFNSSAASLNRDAVFVGVDHYTPGYSAQVGDQSVCSFLGSQGAIEEFMICNYTIATSPYQSGARFFTLYNGGLSKVSMLMSNGLAFPDVNNNTPAYCGFACLSFYGIAAPSTPASGAYYSWFDTTDLRFHEKNSAGAVGTTVVSSTAPSNQFATGISSAGVVSYAQPSVSNLSGLGTGVATALGDNVGSAGAIVTNGGALGTPSSATLTNATGLPISGVTGLGAGVGAALGDAVNTTGGFPTYTASTWTPTITTSATVGTPAYSIQVGSYEQIGRQVTARFSITLSGWTGSPTGNVSVGGLPVAAASTTNDYGGCIITNYTVSALGSSTQGVTGYISPGASSANLVSNGVSGSLAITAAELGTTATVFGTCHYHT